MTTTWDLNTIEIPWAIIKYSRQYGEILTGYIVNEIRWKQ